MNDMELIMEVKHYKGVLEETLTYFITEENITNEQMKTILIDQAYNFITNLQK